MSEETALLLVKAIYKLRGTLSTIEFFFCLLLIGKFIKTLVGWGCGDK